MYCALIKLLHSARIPRSLLSHMRAGPGLLLRIYSTFAKASLRGRPGSRFATLPANQQGSDDDTMLARRVLVHPVGTPHARLRSTRAI